MSLLYKGKEFHKVEGPVLLNRGRFKGLDALHQLRPFVCNLMVEGFSVIELIV